MTKTRYSSVDFGSAKGGLSTVGFVLYDFDGTTKAARSTANVTELGSSTGIYASSFSVEDTWSGLIVWDTGEATPKYAVDEKFSQLNEIQNQTDHIRIIRNTIQQSADYEGELLLKMAGLQENFENIPHTEVMEKVLKSTRDELFDKHNSLVDMINGDMISRVNELKTLIGGIVIVDNSDKLNDILRGIERVEQASEPIKEEIRKIQFPSFTKDLKKLDKLKEFDKVKNELSVVIRKINAFHTDNFREQRDMTNKLMSMVRDKIDALKMQDMKLRTDEMKQMNDVVITLQEINKVNSELNTINSKLTKSLQIASKILDNDEKEKRNAEAEMKRLKLQKLVPLLTTLKGVSNG